MVKNQNKSFLLAMQQNKNWQNFWLKVLVIQNSIAFRNLSEDSTTFHNYCKKLLPLENPFLKDYQFINVEGRWRYRNHNFS